MSSDIYANYRAFNILWQSSEKYHIAGVCDGDRGMRQAKRAESKMGLRRCMQ